MIRRRVRLALVCLVFALGACNAPDVVVLDDSTDDTPIVVLENYSPAAVLAAHYRLGDENEVDAFEVVEVPVGARVSLSSTADADTRSQRVVLMDGICAIWVTEPIAIEGGPDSTLITIDPDRLVRVRSVSDLDPGSPATLTAECRNQAGAVAFPP